MAVIIPIVAKFVDDGIKEATGALKDTENAGSKAARALEALSGPAKVATTAMVGATIAVAKNASGALKANKKLQASFTAVGYPENAAAAMKYADSLQHVIGVSDEEIQATQQKLAAFKDVAKSQDMMARTTLAAANMSAAGFGTMESAATNLGKAITNPIKGITLLERSGVQFTEQQHEQIKAMMEVGNVAGAQAVIMKQVEGTFNGVAEASASGSAKMKLAWDEAAESLGAGLVPVLGVFFKMMTDLGNFMGRHTQAVKVFAVAFTSVTASIVVASSAIKVYKVATEAAALATKLFTAAGKAAKIAQVLYTAATQVAAGATATQASASALAAAGFKAQGIAARLAAAGTKVLSLALKAMGGPIFWIIAAVVLLAVVIIKNWDKIKEVTLKVWGWIKGFLLKTWQAIKDFASKTWESIKNLVQKAWDFIKKVLSYNPYVIIAKYLVNLVRDVIKNWDKIVAFIKNAWAKVKTVFVTNPFNAVKGFLEDMWGWFQNTIGKIKNLLDELLGKAKSIADGVKGAFDKAKSLADKMPKPGGRSVGGATAIVTRSLATPVTRSLVEGVPAPTTGLVPVRRGRDGGGVTINVNGALDPDAVGRQIKRLLENHDVRQGRIRGATRRVAW